MGRRVPGAARWAVHVIGDYKVVSLAARDQYAQHGRYPESAGWGEVPDGMAASLPRGFVFRFESLEYRWRRWALPDGAPGKKGETQLLGLEVRGDDEALLQAVRRLYKGTEIGDQKQVTMLIE